MQLQLMHLKRLSFDASMVPEERRPLLDRVAMRVTATSIWQTMNNNVDSYALICYPEHVDWVRGYVDLVKHVSGPILMTPSWTNIDLDFEFVDDTVISVSVRLESVTVDDTYNEQFERSAFYPWQEGVKLCTWDKHYNWLYCELKTNGSMQYLKRDTGMMTQGSAPVYPSEYVICDNPLQSARYMAERLHDTLAPLAPFERDRSEPLAVVIAPQQHHSTFELFTTPHVVQLVDAADSAHVSAVLNRLLHDRSTAAPEAVLMSGLSGSALDVAKQLMNRVRDTTACAVSNFMLCGQLQDEQCLMDPSTQQSEMREGLVVTILGSSTAQQSQIAMTALRQRSEVVFKNHLRWFDRNDNSGISFGTFPRNKFLRRFVLGGDDTLAHARQEAQYRLYPHLKRHDELMDSYDTSDEETAERAKRDPLFDAFVRSQYAREQMALEKSTPE